MTTVVLASNNAKKLVELRRILEPLVPGIEVLGLGDFPAYPEPAETEPTFAGNALLKARACVAATGLPSLADDSGICIDELNGMPGVLSARWAGVSKADGADAANNRLVLAQLSDTPDERRTAHFECVMAFVTPEGDEHLAVGTMPGVILHAESGVGGFGYDPLFRPEGKEVSSAELSAEEKDSISHRGHALRQIAAVVADALA